MENKKLYVGNLNYAVTEDELKELFSEYGNVTDIRVIEGKGFGFVEMAEIAEAEAVVENLNGKEFKGRTLRIDEARPKKDKPQRGGPRRFDRR